MRRFSAVAGSIAFFAAAPGVVAGLMPWGLTDRYRQPVADRPIFIVLGTILVLAGLAVLVPAFARFALEGRGTPAPVAPAEKLVVGGLYGHVRNPMYLAVLSVIAGQALIFASWPLARRYGADYETYRCTVTGWLPRIGRRRGGAAQ
ncbi:hypothetical protein ATER59S_02781 [Aquamicrobium terrae]